MGDSGLQGRREGLGGIQGWVVYQSNHEESRLWWAGHRGSQMLVGRHSRGWFHEGRTLSRRLIRFDTIFFVENGLIWDFFNALLNDVAIAVVQLIAKIMFIVFQNG